VTLLEALDSYRAAGQPWPATTSDIARWIIEHGHWKQANGSVANCAESLRRAMSRATHIDPQGRRVRTYHGVRR
jgi:hypothetical protein